MDSVTTNRTMLGCCVRWTSANSVCWHGTPPAPVSVLQGAKGVMLSSLLVLYQLLFWSSVHMGRL